ncbi:hypothetical protein LJC64_02390 [Ruminococcaceae bacterium OttesenSCG-928-A11]|nr:hypothetical protein [Ruminococcaceae bacterium OttesenSCG-928-A11]
MKMLETSLDVTTMDTEVHMKVKITLGQELPKETWHAIADHLETIVPHIARVLKHENVDGRGDQDADEFLAEMLAAATAVRYVAEFAADKCRFIAL